MASTAHLDIAVSSGGVTSADTALKQLTQTAKETEKQQERLAAASEKAAERQARAAARAAERAQVTAQRAQAAAEKQVAREAELWNDAKQKAIARYDRQAEAAEKAAARQMRATERAISRENEMWDRAIQRAKAGFDGVLPVRPSLQRMEAAQSEQSGQMAALLSGAGKGALGSVGMGVLAGGAAGIASAAVQTLVGSLRDLKNAVVENIVEDGNMIARLGGVTDSAEQAAETFEDLQRFTFGKLPSQLREVNAAFVQLGNNGLSNSNAALKSYSNIAAQTGNSLTSVANAVQMATMGNYRSLREFGIKVKEEGSNLQVTFRGQTETIGNNAAAIESYMQSLGNVQFAGAVERQMDTVGGAIKKQHDAWEKLINTVGNSSLGSLIAASVGAGVSVIDAMTASVDALFGKIEKGKRELESARRQREEQAKLDKTMMSWADPSASRSEINQLAQELEAQSQSSADKALARFTRIESAIAKLDMLGESRIGDMTIEEARAENERQYRRDNGGTAPPKTGYEPKIASGQQTNFAAYVAMVRKQEYEQYLIVRDTLNKEEDAERASYEKRKDFLAAYTGPDSEALWARNEDLWAKHLDDVAEKAALKQIALQKKLQNIGIGPQSQSDVVTRKYAGQRFELGEALRENMSGKNGEVLKLEAEQAYAEKSIAIERARAQEIAAINRDLVQQSAQNAELIFAGLAEAMKNGHGEMSAEYRTMFAIQKAFGLVSAEIAMYQAMAEAGKQPFPANIPLYLKAAAQGAQIIAQMSSLSYSGAYDKGGGIPDGSYGDVGENDWELVRGAKVAGPAQVIGREATAAMLGSRESTREIIVVDMADAFKNYLGSTAGQRVLRTFVQRNGALIRTVSR